MSSRADQTRGKRPRVAGTSSSVVRPATDRFRFASWRAEDKFESTIKRRPFLYEWTFDFSGRETQSAAVLETIEEQHWGFLLEVPGPTNLTIVREFYANWDHPELTEIHIRGRQLSITPQAIGEALQIPAPPADDIPDEYFQLLQQEVNMGDVLRCIGRPDASWEFNSQSKVIGLKSSQLTFESRLWMRLALSHILPCGHTHLITVEQALLVYCLMERRHIYIPGIVRRHMSRMHEGKSSQGLPYPALVTKMAFAAQVPTLPGDEVGPPSPVIAVKKLYDSGTRSKRGGGAGATTGASPSTPMQAVLARLDSMRLELQAHVTESIQASEERIMRRIARLELRMQGIDPPVEPEQPPPRGRPPSAHLTPPPRRSEPRDDPDSDSREDDPDVEISEDEDSEEDD